MFFLLKNNERGKKATLPGQKGHTSKKDVIK